MIYAGIDAGSRAIKIVLMDADTLEIMGKGLTDQGVEQDRLASELFDRISWIATTSKRRAILARCSITCGLRSFDSPNT